MGEPVTSSAGSGQKLRKDNARSSMQEVLRLRPSAKYDILVSKNKTRNVASSSGEVRPDRAADDLRFITTTLLDKTGFSIKRRIASFKSERRYNSVLQTIAPPSEGTPYSSPRPHTYSDLLETLTDRSHVSRFELKNKEEVPVVQVPGSNLYGEINARQLVDKNFRLYSTEGLSTEFIVDRHIRSHLSERLDAISRTIAPQSEDLLCSPFTSPRSNTSNVLEIGVCHLKPATKDVAVVKVPDCESEVQTLRVNVDASVVDDKIRGEIDITPVADLYVQQDRNESQHSETCASFIDSHSCEIEIPPILVPEAHRYVQQNLDESERSASGVSFLDGNPPSEIDTTLNQATPQADCYVQQEGDKSQQPERYASFEDYEAFGDLSPTLSQVPEASQDVQQDSDESYLSDSVSSADSEISWSRSWRYDRVPPVDHNPLQPPAICSDIALNPHLIACRHVIIHGYKAWTRAQTPLPESAASFVAELPNARGSSYDGSHRKMDVPHIQMPDEDRFVEQSLKTSSRDDGDDSLVSMTTDGNLIHTADEELHLQQSSTANGNVCINRGQEHMNLSDENAVVRGYDQDQTTMNSDFQVVNGNLPYNEMENKMEEEPLRPDTCLSLESLQSLCNHSKPDGNPLTSRDYGYEDLLGSVRREVLVRSASRELPVEDKHSEVQCTEELNGTGSVSITDSVEYSLFPLYDDSVSELKVVGVPVVMASKEVSARKPLITVDKKITCKGKRSIPSTIIAGGLNHMAGAPSTSTSEVFLPVRVSKTSTRNPGAPSNGVAYVKGKQVPLLYEECKTAAATAQTYITELKPTAILLTKTRARRKTILAATDALPSDVNMVSLIQGSKTVLTQEHGTESNFDVSATRPAVPTLNLTAAAALRARSPSKLGLSGLGVDCKLTPCDTTPKLSGERNGSPMMVASLSEPIVMPQRTTSSSCHAVDVEEMPPADKGINREWVLPQPTTQADGSLTMVAGHDKMHMIFPRNEFSEHVATQVQEKQPCEHADSARDHSASLCEHAETYNPIVNLSSGGRVVSHDTVTEQQQSSFSMECDTCAVKPQVCSDSKTKQSSTSISLQAIGRRTNPTNYKRGVIKLPLPVLPQADNNPFLIAVPCNRVPPVSTEFDSVPVTQQGSKTRPSSPTISTGLCSTRKTTNIARPQLEPLRLKKAVPVLCGAKHRVLKDASLAVRHPKLHIAQSIATPRAPPPKMYGGNNDQPLGTVCRNERRLVYRNRVTDQGYEVVQMTALHDGVPSLSTEYDNSQTPLSPPAVRLPPIRGALPHPLNGVEPDSYRKVVDHVPVIRKKPWNCYVPSKVEVHHCTRPKRNPHEHPKPWLCGTALAVEKGENVVSSIPDLATCEVRLPPIRGAPPRPVHVVEPDSFRKRADNVQGIHKKPWNCYVPPKVVVHQSSRPKRNPNEHQKPWLCGTALATEKGGNSTSRIPTLPSLSDVNPITSIAYDKIEPRNRVVPFNNLPCLPPIKGGNSSSTIPSLLSLTDRPAQRVHDNPGMGYDKTRMIVPSNGVRSFKKLPCLPPIKRGQGGVVGQE